MTRKKITISQKKPTAKKQIIKKPTRKKQTKKRQTKKKQRKKKQTRKKPTGKKQVRKKQTSNSGGYHHDLLFKICLENIERAKEFFA